MVYRPVLPDIIFLCTVLSSWIGVGLVLEPGLTMINLMETRKLGTPQNRSDLMETGKIEHPYIYLF